jgi:DNA mismatch repair ATPase MutS
MSEMQRAALLLSMAQSGQPAVFLVDELFRGTNYVEAVSASTAALLRLAEAGCVLATSHNIVLATLLHGR